MKGNKVLLVWPETDKGFYDFSPLNSLFDRKGQFFPLSLLSVAASLGEDWEYSIGDDNIQHVTKNHLRQVDFILISANILQRRSAERIVDIALSLDKPIIIGGPLLSTLDHVFKNPKITKVIGEIEAPCLSTQDQALPMGHILANDMRKGTLRPLYQALGHPDIKRLPSPRYDLVDSKIYFHVSLQTSRGCHHTCDFCQEVALYGRHQRKTNEQVLSELDMLYAKGGGKTVYLIDDNFMGNIAIKTQREEFVSLLKAIYNWQRTHNYPFDFFSQCSLEIAEYDDILELMARIGINMMFVGVETVNNKALAAIHKTQNYNKDQVAKVHKLRHYGMGVFAGLIYGLDQDDASSMDEQINFMRKSQIPLAGLSVLQAPKGTRLFERMEKAGRLSRDPDALTKSFRTNVILTMHPREFYSEYARFAETVYAPREYFERCLQWIQAWNDVYVIPGKKGSIPPNLFFRRVLRSVFYQGVFSGYRYQYWRYVVAVLWKFKRDKNRLALAFYLMYFYRVVYGIKNKICKFKRHVPAELIDEWVQYHHERPI